MKGSILRRFFIYQKSRFPIVIMLASILPGILSSAIIVSAPGPGLLPLSLAMIASVIYLLHIRIVDEHRDFDHDSIHHKDRPIQKGVISLADLRKIDAMIIFAFLAIALSSSFYSFCIAVILLSYTYLAGKEFFLGERIRRRFFIYNAVNLVQMLLLQFFIYGFFEAGFKFSGLVSAHFLFTSAGMLTFEFLRKVKPPGEENTGRDTYTSRIGFGRSIIIHFFLVFTSAALFIRLVELITPQTAPWLSLSVLFVIISLLHCCFYWVKKTKLAGQLLQINFLLTYGFFNLAIYFLKF